MIRDIQASDKARFMELCRAFYDSPAVSHAVDPAFFERTFQEVMDKNPFLRGLVLEQAGELVGYVLLSFTYSNEVGGMVVLLEEIYIVPDKRGCGLGTEVFQFVEREYAGYGRFRLDVRTDNVRAIELYKRQGYEILEYASMVKDI